MMKTVKFVLPTSSFIQYNEHLSVHFLGKSFEFIHRGPAFRMSRLEWILTQCLHYINVGCKNIFVEFKFSNGNCFKQQRNTWTKNVKFIWKFFLSTLLKNIAECNSKQFQYTLHNIWKHGSIWRVAHTISDNSQL